MVSEETPITKCPRLSGLLSISLRVKRDDLYPLSGGGNKARKILPFLEAALKRGSNAIITNGGTQSNHCRVTALKAAELGWRCSLVLHGDREELKHPTGNLKLMALAGASIQIVPPTEIASTISTVEGQLTSDGCNPYVIPGGGHSVLGSHAYYQAGCSTIQQLEADNWVPDFVLLPSGTGATHAGLAVAFQSHARQTRVLGISVARQNPRGTQVVEEAAGELRQYLGQDGQVPSIEFLDQFVAGGYEKYTPEILEFIGTAAREEGLLLDPTYTGKALAALPALRRSGRIPPGSKVLFWHTGGLLNLLSTQF